MRKVKKLFLYIRGQKTAPFKVWINNGRSPRCRALVYLVPRCEAVFRFRKPRASVQGASFFLVAYFTLCSLIFAQDKVAILVSGQSHSSLYHCACPSNPIGGVSRRATLINDVRSKENNVIVLEAGGSFAGGKSDANSLTVELDKSRTDFYMQSLVAMNYDAFLISSEEFNFDQEFLDTTMSKYKLNYLSANLRGAFSPYIIKDIGKFKLAIVGLTDPTVKAKTKLEYISEREVLTNTVKELKDKKVNVIVVLSYLGIEEAKQILSEVKEIDVLISSDNQFMSSKSEEIGGKKIIIPAWETRALTKVDITFDNANPHKISVESIDLGKDIKDDTKINSIIPQCFRDKDCRKQGFSGECKNPGAKGAECFFSQLGAVKISVIKPDKCRTCNIEGTIEQIKKILPNLEVSYLSENDTKAKSLIKKLEIKMLPAYVLDKSIEKEEKLLSRIKDFTKKIKEYFVFEPGFTGVSYFVNREKIDKRLDVFFDINTKNIVKILEVIDELKLKRKDIDVRIHFLAIEDAKGGFVAKGGRYEVEEYLRSACVNKYYPDRLGNYLSCRLQDIESSWWDDCVVKFGIDPSKIKVCAQTKDGADILKNLIKLTQELEVVFGPTYLVDNQEVFSSEEVPRVEELEELFK